MPSSSRSPEAQAFYSIASEAPIAPLPALALLRTSEHLLPGLALSYGLVQSREAATLCLALAVAALILRRIWGGRLRTTLRERLLVLGAERLLSSEGALRGSRGPEAAQFVVEGGVAASSALADHVPDAIGSAVAGVILLTATCWVGAGTATTGSALGVSALVVSVPLLILPVAWRAERRASRSWIAFAGRVATLAQTAIEISAMGREKEVLGALRARGQRWRGESLRADALSAFPYYASAILGLLMATLVLPGLTPMTAGLGALSGYALLSSVRAGATVIRLAKAMDPYLAVLREAPLPTGQGIPAPPGPPRLQAHNLRVSFPSASGGRTAFSGVSFLAIPGEILVVRGPNGAGKTTLLRAIAGLHLPTTEDALSGQLRVNGTPLHELDMISWRRQLVFLPQRPFLPETLTVREALSAVGAQLPDHGLRQRLMDVQIAEHLQSLAGGDPLDAPVRMLSVGQLQLVSIAAAWASDRPLLLMDEPDAVLGARSTSVLLTALGRMAQEERTVILTTHSVAFHDYSGRWKELLLHGSSTPDPDVASSPALS